MVTQWIAIRDVDHGAPLLERLLLENAVLVETAALGAYVRDVLGELGRDLFLGEVELGGKEWIALIHASGMELLRTVGAPDAANLQLERRTLPPLFGADCSESIIVGVGAQTRFAVEDSELPVIDVRTQALDASLDPLLERLRSWARIKDRIQVAVESVVAQ